MEIIHFYYELGIIFRIMQTLALFVMTHSILAVDKIVCVCNYTCIFELWYYLYETFNSSSMIVVLFSELLHIL